MGSCKPNLPKWGKIRTRFLLITNRRLHTHFWLVSKSTLDNLNGYCALCFKIHTCQKILNYCSIARSPFLLMVMILILITMWTFYCCCTLIVTIIDLGWPWVSIILCFKMHLSFRAYHEHRNYCDSTAFLLMIMIAIVILILITIWTFYFCCFTVLLNLHSCFVFLSCLPLGQNFCSAFVVNN